MECGLTGDPGFRHGLVALAWPAYADQDMLFRDVDAMRDSPAFTEWAMVLFNRWAPPDYVATLEDDADVCSRDLLLAHALSVPADCVPTASAATRYWLAAWWRRLYGPLLSFDRVYRLSRDPSGGYSRPLLGAAVRLGPGVFKYLTPSAFCWKHHLAMSLVGICTANCICDTLY